MINGYLTLLTEELLDDGVPDPLGQTFTLAALWEDLCRLAGETPPADIRQRHEGDSPLAKRPASSAPWRVIRPGAA